MSCTIFIKDSFEDEFISKLDN